jgi:hypothetical protein
MFCSRSWPFSLLPSCLPKMSPVTVQVAGNLSYYLGSHWGLVWGNRPEHMLGCLGFPQGHDLPATLELPVLHGSTLQN